MSNTSATGGYLAPSSFPAYDGSLDTVFQKAVVGIVGLNGTLVRPRWQPKPPVNPAPETDWCAFGVVLSPTDAFAYEWHDPSGGAGAGQDVVEFDEEFRVLHSFYGPNATKNSRLLRAGLQISQNRDVLKSVGVVIQEIGEATQVPALLADLWVKRVDVPVIYRRRASARYDILTIQSGQLGLDNELWVTPIVIN